MIQLLHGDCLELMKNIPDGSVDLVLTDPPYGTMGGIKRNGKLIERSRNHNRIDDMRRWDSNSLDEQRVLQELSRILRPNGKALLFAQEPYTSKLILANVPSLPFSQRLHWKKNVAGNFLCSSQNCMQYIEDICLFSKIAPKHDFEGLHPLRDWFMKEKEKCVGVDFRELLGNGMASHYFTNGSQFALPTKTNFEKLQSTGHFQRDYEELKAIHEEWQKNHIQEMNIKYPSVFNLWQGGKSKSNVFEYKKDNDGYHPTQKPVALLEDLIQTYSNEGNTVLDFTMGSGSTGVACVNTNRHFIGIELEEEYFKIAEERINNARFVGAKGRRQT